MLTDAIAGVLVMVAYRITTMSIAFIHNLSAQKSGALAAIMADLRDVSGYWAKSIVVFIAGFVISCLIRQMIPSRREHEAATPGTN